MAAIPGRGIFKGAGMDDEPDAGELLVFGYSCKLFRDDEKATYIDQGKHLIPWMGDNGHMIDRYDGRGYIHDLREYEPIAGRGDPWENLSPEERHIESICDEERYAALTGDPAENDLYHEEEIKRLKASLDDDSVYNQVGFSYDAIGGSTATEASLLEQVESPRTHDRTNKSLVNAEEQVFVPAKELNIPASMQVPESAKENAIVERTALFVVRQGGQMEILIKAKQSANPQFAFLAFDHPLNPYYKHVIQMVKNGKYIPKPPSETKNGSDDDDDDDNDGHYLHPSLMATKELELTVPKLNYAWTGDDPYSLLVSRLKDKVEMDAKMNCLQPVISATAVDSTLRPETLAGHPPPPPPGLEPVTLPVGGDGMVVDFSVDQPLQIAGLLWPPADVIPIVDKMASYVAKNGEHFEAVVRSKSLDARFGFLNPGHPYHAYYLFKRKLFEKDTPRPSVTATPSRKQGSLQQPLMEDDTSQDVELRAGSAVVSFSIKMREGGGGGTPGNGNEKRRTFTDGNGDAIVVSPLTRIDDQQQQPPPKELTEEEKRLKAKLDEARLAEKRIRDKLAAAARERLAQASREKQLQLERKRKAALFLTMLRRDREADGCGGYDDNDDPDAPPMIGPKLPTTVEMTQMIMREDSPPILALVAAQVESMSAAPSLKAKSGRDASGSVVRERRHRSRSPRDHPRSDSRSRHRSSHRRSESRGRHGGRRREHHRARVESRRSRSPRPSRSSKDDHRVSRRSRKTKSPPAAYSSSGKKRSSRSPHRRTRRHSSSSRKKKSSRSHRRRSRTRSRSHSGRARRDRGGRKSSTSSSSSSSSLSSVAASIVSSASSASSSATSIAASCATVSSGSSKSQNHKPPKKAAAASSKSKKSSESTKGKASKSRSSSIPKSKKR